MIAGLLSARFRDLPQIIRALIQIAFYVTPIMYRPNALSRFTFIVEWNPLAYLIDLVRAPLIGQMPSELTWGVCIGMAVIGWLLALEHDGSIPEAHSILGLRDMIMAFIELKGATLDLPIYDVQGRSLKKKVMSMGRRNSIAEDNTV